MYQILLEKIKSKKISVSIIGMGYVGLPLALRFLKKKINILAIDNDKNKILNLRSGKSYIKDIKNKELNYFKKNKKNLSSDFSLTKYADVIILCLPTPLLKNKNPDMSSLFNAAKKISPFLGKGKIIILESTVYPGATVDLIKKFNLKNLKLGEDIFISYSPERENPGDKSFNYQKTPKLVSGYSKKCLYISKKLYSLIVKKVIPTRSIEVAETSKLLENLYRSVNIGLVNEFKIICNKLKIDVDEVIAAAATKNFGFQKFNPGPGMGGHCIPIDPYYLSWASNKKGYLPKFIKTSGDINSLIPKWIVSEIIKFFKLKNIKFSNKRILLIGISYKKNISDDRESPAFMLIKVLKKFKITFDYFDPYFHKISKGRNFSDDKRSIRLNSKNIKKYLATLIVTDHDNIDYDLICKNSKYVFDTRGRLRNLKKKYTNIIPL